MHLMLRYALLLVAMLMPLALTAADAQAPRPNILFILADDLGWKDTGFNGGEINTPHLDRLATNGVQLRQFYVQPVCSPTRAALLTGRYPMRYGLQVGVVRPWAQYGLPLEERTLAQALREAGYFTALCGKWHLGAHAREYLPTRRGFDHQYGHYSGAIDYFTHERDGGFDWHRNDRVLREKGYSTFLIAREAVRLLERHDTNKPIFLYLAFNAVHAPHQVPPEYKTPYQHLKEPRRTYAGMLSAMDEAIGQVLATLTKKGIREQTLVFFCSDNGGPRPGIVSDNGPWRAGKGTLYEGGIRSVACVNWPGRLGSGRVIDYPFHIADCYPTFLKLAGASLDQRQPIDGQDIWPILTGRQAAAPREILHNSTPSSGALRLGDWKLILNGTQSVPGTDPDATTSNRNPSLELFNLANDPGEKKNLATLETKKAQELRSRYEMLARQAVPPRNRPPPRGFKAPAVWGEP